jgi:undecaprenyl diphosphate synthase
VRKIVEASIDLGIHDLSIFAFSTENWSRPREEVDALMEIFAETIERELPDLTEQGVRVRFIGRRDRAPEALRSRMAAMEDRTELNTRLNLWVAFDYGGRAELVEAARRLAESGVEPDEIDENVFAANLYAPELPDPDLLIRTSGELRVSNFLLWQLAYAELHFVDKLWPDFGPRDLEHALDEYANRRRRFGGR